MQKVNTVPMTNTSGQNKNRTLALTSVLPDNMPSADSVARDRSALADLRLHSLSIFKYIQRQSDSAALVSDCSEVHLSWCFAGRI